MITEPKTIKAVKHTVHKIKKELKKDYIIATNVNEQHKKSLNAQERLALKITTLVGSMWCAYLFTIIALISLPGVLGTHNVVNIVSWVAQTFLQLVLLSIIMVGQNLQSRHSELLAEEDFRINKKAEEEIKKL